MKAVSRVWSALEVYVQAMSFLLALFCVFTIATPHVQAATLTTSQIEGISALLLSLKVDQVTIDKVKADLSEVSQCERSGMVVCPPAAVITPVPVMLPLAPTTTSSYVFSASPTAGTMPLDVTFNVQGTISNLLTIYYGDTSKSSCVSDQCAGSTGWTVSHTYAKPGVYTAKLVKESPPCTAPVGTACNVLPVVSLGTVVITVNATSAPQTSNPAPTCTLKASRISLGKGNQVTLTWTSQNATYSSTSNGGTDGKPQGTLIVKPT